MPEFEAPADAGRAHAGTLTVLIGDKQYSMQRTSVGDMAALCESIRNRRISAVMGLRARLPAPDLFAKALAYTIAREPTEQEMWEAVTTLQGQRLLVWRSIAHHHADLTLQAFDELIEANGGMAELLTIGSMLSLESGLVVPRQEGEEVPDPTSAQPSTGPEMPPCFAQSTDSPPATSPPSNGGNTPPISDTPPTFTAPEE